MMSRKPLFVLVAVCCWSAGFASGEERTTVWFTLDSAKIGPIVSCDGEFQVDGGKLFVKALREWMGEGKDGVDGASYRLTSEHDAESAAAAKLQRVRRTTLPKGLLLEIEAPAQATLKATTKLGDFEVALEELRRERAVSVLDGKVRLQLLPNTTALTGDQGEEEFPSLAVLPDGRVAVAYVAWDGKADRVFLQLGDQTRQVTKQPGDYLDPRCAVDGEGKLWVVWAANDGQQWDLWASSDGAPVKLTSNARNDFWPRLARDAQGRLMLAWQTVADDLHYEVMLARLGPDGLTATQDVSDHASDDWEPALVAAPDGRIVVAWDTYRNGSYDIYLREFTPRADGGLEPLGPPLAVAATAEREAHATIAADSDGRVWLAWDVSMEDWGKHPKVAGTLHAFRRTEVACYAGGKLQRLASEFMDSLPKPFGKFVEYPQIALDGKGRLWLFWRMENEVRVSYHNPKQRAGQNWATWHLFASQYDGEKWAEPVMLARSNGRQDMRVDTAQDPSGDLLVVFGADGRTRRFPYMPVDYDVFTASLAGFGAPMGDMKLADAGNLGQVAAVNPDPELAPLPRSWTVGGKTYCLVLGDTHRHTDISRCQNGYDGSLQDAYRYALDACQLDWLAISDHDQDILKHRNDRNVRPRQDYDWWRSQKYCDLYTIPGRFLALYGYEHGGSYKGRGGHKNVVLAERGFPVYEVDDPKALFAALADSGAVAIPHQLADGGSRTDWEKWDRKYEAVAEIYQTRGSYEYADCPRIARIFTPGHSIWDALARDVRIGIIASSDHGETHQARACTYVEDAPGATGDVSAATGFTRQGILEALHTRRTFGATTAVTVRMSIADRPLGEEITVDGPPTIEASVVAPAEVTALAVVRDGSFVYTIEPKTKEASFQFNDLDLKPGQSAYYYIRALIGETDVAWSSPIWVTRE
ncbi:MAG: hypothetical protein ABIP48_28535 [Planctomycetota bacterium]